MCKRFVLAALIIFLAAECSAATFQIIHSNDRHGYVEKRVEGDERRVGGASVEATMIHSLKLQARRDNVPSLLVDCGDFFQGTPLVNSTKGKIMIDIFNEMGYHFVTFGNHEFDYGWQALKERMKESNFLWLSTTVEAPQLEELYLPWLTYTLDGSKIAFLGATTPNTPEKQLKKRITGITFHRPVERIKSVIEALSREADIKTIVLISHLGLDVDREIARQVPELDLILGGHSHSVLHEPEKVGKTYICQTGTASRYLGVVRIDTDDNGSIQEIDSRLEAVDDRKWLPNDGVAQIVDGYASALEAELAQVAGIAPLGLKKGVRGGSTPLARAVARAFRESVDAEIGFMNIGGARKCIPEGEVTLKHIKTAVPFGNYVVRLKMKGRDVRRVIEASVNQPYAPIPEDKIEMVVSRGVKDLSGLVPVGSKNGFIVGDGLTYVFDPSKDVGSRLVSITVNGKPLEENRVYTVAINDFLADGGDGFTAFTSHLHREDMEFVDFQAFRAWCERQDVILKPKGHTVINLTFDSLKDSLSAGEKSAVR
jgi:5'-nucleotidase